LRKPARRAAESRWVRQLIGAVRLGPMRIGRARPAIGRPRRASALPELSAAILIMTSSGDRWTREAGREGLLLAVAFGSPLAGMNFLPSRGAGPDPLGIAVNFESSALLVGLFGSRRPLDIVWVACRGDRVMLLTRPQDRRRAGIGLELLAGVAGRT